jgi:hypothetical protein
MLQVMQFVVSRSWHTSHTLFRDGGRLPDQPVIVNYYRASLAGLAMGDRTSDGDLAA